MENYESFEEMNLKEDILKGIFSCGFEKPSHIQKIGIMPIINGKNVILQSQSGTGKTCVFSISSLEIIDQEIKKPQVLIISSTRELAEQTFKVIKTMSSYTNIISHCCIGGKNYQEDILTLENGVHIISGTPGRIFDMISRKSLDIKYLKLLIIDEVDIMLAKGFKAQIYEIYRFLDDLQIVIASATYTEEIINLSESFMKDPIKIMTDLKEVALKKIKQTYILFDDDYYKFETLIDLYEILTISQAIIFCNSIERVEWLTNSLKKNNFSVCYMHGKWEQKERDSVMSEFRIGHKRILVASDIWARGLDVQQVSLVINYDFPSDKEKYIHRIGRSGRFGKNGLAINFILNEEFKTLKEVEKYYSTKIEEHTDEYDEYINYN